MITRRKVIGCGLAALGAPLIGKSDITKSLLGANGTLYTEQVEPGFDNPYLTDGLVAMWDAAWNVKSYEHDPTSTTWYDLSGKGHTLQSLGSPDWRNEDGIYGAYMTTNANCFNNMNSGWFRDLWASEEGVYVEAVAKGAYDYVVFGFGGQQETWQSYDISVKNVNANVQFLRARGVDQWFESHYLQTPYKVWCWQNLDSFEAAANNLSPVTGEYTYTPYSANGFSIGCRGDHYGTLSIKGLIYRVSVYDRYLTQEERDYNYAVDKLRFNLP